jgi:hypothetical protein
VTRHLVILDAHIIVVIIIIIIIIILIIIIIIIIIPLPPRVGAERSAAGERRAAR